VPVISAVLSALLSVLTLFVSFGVKANPPNELGIFDVGTVRMFMLSIENVPNGKIEAIKGGSVSFVGEVIKPAVFAERTPDLLWSYHYCKAQNGSFGAVVGTAVNSIDIRCGPSRIYDPTKPDSWLTSMISIVPFTMEDVATDKDMVVTCPGGSDVFNKWSPYVGSSVYALENDKWIPITQYFTSPMRGAPARILIDVRSPVKWFPYIEFENWTNGDTIKGETLTSDGGVWVKMPDGERKQIAKVIQRVESTGMFPGSEYAEVGQVRANTPGMIEIATNRWRGKIDDENLRGGIEIIAENDAKYIHNNLGLNWIIGGKPYMIIGAMDSSSDDLSNKQYTDDNGLVMTPTIGLPPFFNGYIRPCLEFENFETSFRVFISEDFGRTWRSIPEISGVPENGQPSQVKYWTNIRLMLGR
jgi:hypothetical protein